MNKLKIIIFSVLCVVISCGSLFGKPSIQFSRLEHDFGVIRQNTAVKEVITFKNAGNSDLKIKKVETSCGCTGTKVDKTTIKPGEEGTLEITFNSGHNNGQVQRSITIHTNDPKNSTVVFRIKAIVR